MKFHSLTTASVADEHSMEKEYKSAREIGIIRLGEQNLYFRKKLKVYFIPYTEITRCFRRVMTVSATLCCGRGDFAIENLVICVGDSEVAQIQLPGTKAAQLLMEELKTLIPNAQFSCPNNTNESTKETEE